MEMNFKTEFMRLWEKYFNQSSLPITFYYTDRTDRAEYAKPGSLARCIVGALAKVREGNSYAFDVESVGCFGGKRYLGFSAALAPNFEYFLSCGLPGQFEGERYKKSPKIVRQLLQNWPRFQAPAKYIVFKRWDKLEDTDTPEVVIFFARPDVLAGLYTLANYDTDDPNAVITPMGSGCSSIVQNPYLEKDSPQPKGIIGMFDPSARPFVADNELSFAVPMKKFKKMVDNMDESFLNTRTWKTLQKRIK